MMASEKISPQHERTARWPWFIAGSLLGAAAMYLLDPRQGARRRAQLKDKAIHWSHTGTTAVWRTLRRSKHRLIGLYARSRQDHDIAVDDDKLTSRVRSEFGRKLRHARSIESKVIGGVVTLSGPVLKDEVESLIECVRQVPGVKNVVNELEIHDFAEGVSSLQGKGKAYLQ